MGLSPAAASGGLCQAHPGRLQRRCHRQHDERKGHPPVYYLPPADIMTAHLVPAGRSSYCEWKGAARYFDMVVGDQRVSQCAWSYPNPTSSFAAIRDYVAFYCARMDACLVDGEMARPQPGGFYGGWITDDVVGPFKGEPGTGGW